MDQKAKARIMSSEYKKNDGRATDASKRVQRAADKNYPQHGSQAQSAAYGNSPWGGEQADDEGGWCVIL